MNQREQVTQMFDAIDSDGRRYILALLRGEFERVQKARHPTLRLVEKARASSPATAAPPSPRPALAILPTTQQPQGAAR